MSKLIWSGGARELSEAPLLIGRDPVACDIAIEDDSLLSRIHFAVVPGPGATFLLDLRSSNGTYVNESRVHYSRLQDGDVIQAGSGSYRYQDTGAGEPHWALLKEPAVAFLARSSRDVFVEYLRRLQQVSSWQEALQASAEGLHRASLAEGLSGTACFALGLDGTDPVCRAAAGAPSSYLVEILGPLVAHFRHADRPLLVRQVDEEPGFLPSGYPIRVENVGSVAAAPLGRRNDQGFLSLVSTRGGISLGPEHLVSTEAFALPLSLAIESLTANRAEAP